jgi:PTH1 family peptidyl-tRNA hydrolase
VSSRFLIVGLGNPGAKYAETRHNAGFWFLDHLAEHCGARFRLRSRLHAEIAKASIKGQDCILARPTTFMNCSGQAVGSISQYFKVSADRMLIAYDELDLPPGVARLKQGGGHGGHNGLRDVFRHLDDREFLRLRIGIGHPGLKDAVTAYVLSRAPAAQQELIRQSIKESVDSVPDVLAGNVSGAMKKLHTEAG